MYGTTSFTGFRLAAGGTVKPHQQLHNPISDEAQIDEFFLIYWFSTGRKLLDQKVPVQAL
jgi:hypothetical protein